MRSVLLLLALTSCADLAPHANAPVAKDGAIDLSQWDFERDGPVTLDGTWDFIWHALPADHDDLVTRPRTAAIRVPEQWDSFGFDGTGYGTYRLRLRLPPVALAVSKTHADSAWQLFADVDGARTPVMGGGVPAVSAADEIPYAKFALGELPRATDMVLVEGVSNFVYPRGGQGASTTIGTRDQLEELRDAQRERNFFLVGFILVVGLYHLVLFALRTNERAPLWFGLFCIVMATRDLERGRHLEDLLPALHLWAASKRVEYLGFYFAAPLFIAYLDALLGYDMSRIAKRAFVGAWLALASVVVVAPPIVFGYTAKPAQVVVVACIAWIIFAIVRSLRKSGDRILLVVLLGFVILGATILLDILSNADVIGLPILTPVGQAAFVVAQAAVIAAANARARKDVERLSKLKDEFLANTSHELRTPLNAIINIPQGILGQIEDRSAIVCSSCGAQFEADEDAALADMACPSCNATTLALTTVKSYADTGDALAAHLRSIIGSGEQLLAVVNDILDFSKLAAGQLTLHREDLDAADVVTRAIAVVAPLAAAAKVNLVSKAAHVSFNADRVRMAQVLVNLVANAVKFSPAGADVDVSAVDAGADVVFQVVDRGVGIAPEHHALIFESFRQVEAGHTRKHGGTGLGLSIVKQLVELHDGAVSVSSQLGKGAVFTVRLPRAPRREGSP